MDIAIVTAKYWPSCYVLPYLVNFDMIWFLTKHDDIFFLFISNAKVLTLILTIILCFQEGFQPLPTDSQEEQMESRSRMVMR